MNNDKNIEKRALITGVTGQDGSYLLDYLESLGYEVHGLLRRSSSFNTSRIEHYFKEDYSGKATFHYGDLTDYGSLVNIIRDVEPHEVYNLGAQSHVRVSFDMPIFTGSVTGLGTSAILEAIRKTENNCIFYQASSSEMFGSASPPQNENSKFHPRSPYAAAKMYSYWMTVNYREAYGLNCSNGILFNHESPRRGGTFVTKKIVSEAVKIKLNLKNNLELGNLEAKRDWGYAPEYVMGMKKIVDNGKADDFVIGTGKTISVRTFLELVFKYIELDPYKYVKFNDKYLRPSEVDDLQADMSFTFNKLKWKPEVHYDKLIKIMVDYELRKNGIDPPKEGDVVLSEERFKWIRD